jgi:ArsR family transcriptional regulator, arsenate/arsenite/antimonite-responsive transcriptional repressor
MDAEKAILALAALAQKTRLDVFRLLVKREPEGLPVGEIASSSASRIIHCRPILPAWG